MTIEDAVAAGVEGIRGRAALDGKSDRLPGGGSRRCCFCRGALHAGGASWRCPDCGVLIHARCARELRGPNCPTLGCASKSAWAWAERPPAPSLWLGEWVFTFAMLLAMLLAGTVGLGVVLTVLVEPRVRKLPEPEPGPVVVEPCIYFPSEEVEPQAPGEPKRPRVEPSAFSEGTTFVTHTRRHVERIQSGECSTRTKVSRTLILRRMVLVQSSAESSCGNQWSYSTDLRDLASAGQPEFSTWTVSQRAADTSVFEGLIRVPAGEFLCYRTQSIACGIGCSAGTTTWWCRELPIPVRIERTESSRGERAGEATSVEEVTELVAIEAPNGKLLQLELPTRTVTRAWSR